VGSRAESLSKGGQQLHRACFGKMKSMMLRWGTEILRVEYLNIDIDFEFWGLCFQWTIVA